MIARFLLLSLASAATLPSPLDDTLASYTLVANGDFESAVGTDLTGWSHTYSSQPTTSATFGYATAASWAGAGSAGLLDPAFTNTGPGIALSTEVPVAPSTTYVLSGYVWNRLQGGSAYIDLNDVGFECSAATTACKDDWEFVHCTFTTSSATTVVTVRAVIDGDVPAGSEVYFDEIAVTLEPGFVAPDSLDEDCDTHEEPADCDDLDPDVHPDAIEVWYDGVDQDCDGASDYDQDGDGEDRDLDGGTDCDDLDPSRYAGAVEVPDGIDQDCDGVADDGTPVFDDDGDGFTEEGGDCEDGDPTVHPAAQEVCDGADEDCDGVPDDGTACADDDGDGYSEEDGDCDDGDGAVAPGASEVVDGVDQDCDGMVDDGTVAWDDDGDGFAEDGGDCDDGDSGVDPAAPESCDGVDEDCDGTTDEETPCYDDDGDGVSEDDGDCDDGEVTVNPAAAEVADGIDQDCDGTVDEGTEAYDDDGDGFTEEGGDCEDAESAVHPGAADPCDGVDQNCDGSDGACDTGEVPDPGRIVDTGTVTSDKVDAGSGGCSCDTRGGALAPAWLLLALALVRRKR